MKEYKYINENGVEIKIETLGFFRVPELDKEFVMHSMVDNDPNRENGSVLISEIVKKEDGTAEILDIKDDEVDLVIAFYNEISNQIGGEV